MNHGSCALCGRDFRTAKAKTIAKRRAAIIRDLEGKGPAEHLRGWWQTTFGIDHSDAKAKAARTQEYRQTGNIEQDATV